MCVCINLSVWYMCLYSGCMICVYVHGICVYVSVCIVFVCGMCMMCV